MYRIYYNPKLKELARQLRNNPTKSEKRLWNYLRGKRMKGYDFHRQKPIDNYIADFYCSKLMLVIELDGYTHMFEKTYQKDLLKEQRFNELGIKVIRFTDEYVMNNLQGALECIEDFIVEYETTHPSIPS